MSSKPLIDGRELDETFRYCLYTDEEVRDNYPPKDCVLVTGIAIEKIGLHPGRVEEVRPIVKEMLSNLPDTFMSSKGGGMSTLEMCVDKNGTQWGEHRSMEQLCCLAIALKLGKWCLEERMLWSMLPGGMPYFVVLENQS
jgi:hypothetical protein